MSYLSSLLSNNSPSSRQLMVNSSYLWSIHLAKEKCWGFAIYSQATQTPCFSKVNSSATSAWKATVVLRFQFCQCCIFQLSLAREHQCCNHGGPSGPASRPPRSTHPCVSSHLVPSKLLKNSSTPFLKYTLHGPLFSLTVTFCLELSGLTLAIRQHPSPHPPLSPL